MSINFVQIKISYHEKHRELVSDELPTFLDIVQHYYYLKHKELEETEWTLTNTLAENVTKVQGYKIYIKGYCKHNFMQGWQYPIHNSTIERFVLIKFELKINVYNLKNGVFSVVVSFSTKVTSAIRISPAGKQIGIQN